MAALTHTTVRVPFAMPAGAKTVPISVIATDSGGDQATWSGTVGLAAKPAPAGGGPPAIGVAPFDPDRRVARRARSRPLR